MRRRFVLFAFAWLAVAATAAEISPPLPFDRVIVAPAKTSIYVGSVALTMPDFVRKSGAYESSYEAKVFPFFFSHEQGRVLIEVSDEMLQQLESGQPINFKGRGVRDDGIERRLEGTATPANASTGRLKVRVFVSKRIELIFNTTYRFER